MLSKVKQTDIMRKKIDKLELASLSGVASYILNSLLGTFRSDYDYEYEYEFFNVYPVRMPDCVRLSRQLVLS